MNAKYELIAEKSITIRGKKLFRIRALVSFGGVTKGDEGGYIEKEENLSATGNAWVYGDALVSGDAHILWISNVGGEFGTLTAFRNKAGGITVTRGCFIGTFDRFRAAVSEKHGGTPHEVGYQKLADYIEFHFTELHPSEGDAV